MLTLYHMVTTCIGPDEVDLGRQLADAASLRVDP